MNIVKAFSKLMMVTLLATVISTVAAAPPKRIFVTNEKDDTVSVIDGATNTVVATIEIGGRPRGIGIAPS